VKTQILKAISEKLKSVFLFYHCFVIKHKKNIYSFQSLVKAFKTEAYLV